MRLRRTLASGHLNWKHDARPWIDRTVAWFDGRQQLLETLQLPAVLDLVMLGCNDVIRWKGVVLIHGPGILGVVTFRDNRGIATRRLFGT